MKILCVGSHLFEPTHHSIGAILLGIARHAEIEILAKKPRPHPLPEVPRPGLLDLAALGPDWRPDADLVHAVSAGVTSIRIAERLADDVPLVVSVAGGADLSRELVDPRLAEGYQHLFARADAITVPFPQATAALLAAGAPRRSIVEIPLGLPARAYPAHAPGERATAVWAGRRRQRKNRALALEVLARSVSLDELLVVGEKHGDEASVGDPRATFLGTLDHGELLPLMARATLFLQTGWTAGEEIDVLPTVILEALAIGMPVVSTPLAGVRDLAERHPDLVHLGADAGELAAACDRVIAEGTPPARAVRLEILAEHSLNGAVERFLGLYRRLLAAASARRPG